ncbi:MAG: hypothetical protein OHK0046_13800 [Anaerolineae bacterium]
MEPSPEFETTCIEIVQQWQSGKLAFKDALARLSRLSEEAAHSGHIANQARAQDRLGYLQTYRGNLLTSIDHYNTARALYRVAGNETRLATIDLNQGENHRMLGEASTALELYHAAYAQAEKHSLLNIQTLAALNEGLLLLETGQDTNARRCLEQALELLEHWVDEPDLRDGVYTEAYFGLALLELRVNALQAAWDYAVQVWTIAQHNPLPLHVGFANRTVGEVLAVAGQAADDTFSSDANVYFENAIRAFKEMNAEVEAARTMLSQALYLAHVGNTETAARKLQQVTLTFTKLGMLGDAARAATAQRELA